MAPVSRSVTSSNCASKTWLQRLKTSPFNPSATSSNQARTSIALRVRAPEALTLLPASRTTEQFSSSIGWSSVSRPSRPFDHVSRARSVESLHDPQHTCLDPPERSARSCARAAKHASRVKRSQERVRAAQLFVVSRVLRIACAVRRTIMDAQFPGRICSHAAPCLRSIHFSSNTLATKRLKKLPSL